MSLLLRLQGPPPAFQPEEDYWLQLYVRLAPQLAWVFAADDDIVPQPVVFSPDEDYWFDARSASPSKPLWIVTADDEIVPKLEEDYWLQLLVRHEPRLAALFSVDDEIAPQPIAFVPDEEYGPRLVLIDDAQFVQLWGSDDGASVPAPAGFVPEEDYWQRVLLLEKSQFAQMWGSDGAAASAAGPEVPPAIARSRIHPKGLRVGPAAQVIPPISPRRRGPRR